MTGGGLMTWPAWLCRIVPCLGRRQAEEDRWEELRLHLERQRQREAGLPEPEAGRAARMSPSMFPPPLGDAAVAR